MLIVIDMQPDFEAGTKILSEVIRRIEEAKLQNDWIAIVTYHGHRGSYLEILDSVKGYGRLLHVDKKIQDGSERILEEIKKVGICTPDVLDICGVNADECVLSTVEGLACLLPNTKIHVLVDACATYDEDFFPAGEYTRTLETFENVVLLCHPAFCPDTEI